MDLRLLACRVSARDAGGKSGVDGQSARASDGLAPQLQQAHERGRGVPGSEGDSPVPIIMV